MQPRPFQLATMCTLPGYTYFAYVPTDEYTTPSDRRGQPIYAGMAARLVLYSRTARDLLESSVANAARQTDKSAQGLIMTVVSHSALEPGANWLHAGDKSADGPQGELATSLNGAVCMFVRSTRAHTCLVISHE